MAATALGTLFRGRGVRTWFDARGELLRAVDGVDFEVPRGGALGVVGESGSGKTQLFLSVLGLTSGLPGIVAGTAEFDGLDLLEGIEDFIRLDPSGRGFEALDTGGWRRRHQSRTKRLESRVSLLFQEPRSALLPYWTVQKHFKAVLAPAPDWRARAEAAIGELGFVDPGRVLGALPEELSGGEAQRVMLALSMVLHPDLLIADEPTTAVDAVSQTLILDRLVAMRRDPDFSLVIISHDLAVVKLLAGPVMVMFRGRVVERLHVDDVRGLESELTLADEAGSAPEDDRPHHHHPYTRELLLSQASRAAGLPIVVDGGGHGELEAVSSGCRYRGRCQLFRGTTLDPAVRTRCESDEPELREIGPDRSIACWAVAP